MKKYIFILLAALTFVACSEDEELQFSFDENGNITSVQGAKGVSQKEFEQNVSGRGWIIKTGYSRIVGKDLITPFVMYFFFNKNKIALCKMDNYTMKYIYSLSPYEYSKTDHWIKCSNEEGEMTNELNLLLYDKEKQELITRTPNNSIIVYRRMTIKEHRVYYSEIHNHVNDK